MGVGKTATCQVLKQKSDNSVFLDGDWCWDMHPFQVTQETKKMVLESIAFLLNNFIHCPAYENIIFCWVMHEQGIIDDILSRLDTSGCQVHAISLKIVRSSSVINMGGQMNKGLSFFCLHKRLPPFASLGTLVSFGSVMLNRIRIWNYS